MAKLKVGVIGAYRGNSHLKIFQAEWPNYRDYQRENREKRLNQLRMMNDLYTSYLY